MNFDFYSSDGGYFDHKERREPSEADCGKIQAING